MKIRFTQITNEPADFIRSYQHLFGSLSSSIVKNGQTIERKTQKRKHDYDSSGKLLEIPKDANGEIKLNTVVVNVKNPNGEIKERVIDYLGNKLLLSSWQKREFSPELIKELEKLGQETFEENSHHNVVIQSNKAIVHGNNCLVENSNSAKVYGNNCLVEKSNGAKIYGDNHLIKNMPETTVRGSSVSLKETSTVPNFRKYVTPSQIYSYYMCHHRPWRDANVIQTGDTKAVEFLELLWNKGIQHEKKIISGVSNYVDLSKGTDSERFEQTINAMKKGVPLIYQGVLMVDELYGEPDLLERQADGTYKPVDIKAAMATESSETVEGKEEKLKEYYAMQLGLYADALIRLGFGKEKKGTILDIEGKKVEYDLNLEKNKRDRRTWWEIYKITKDEVLALIQNRAQNDPALGAQCKLCKHIAACTAWCEEHGDISLIYKLGRTNKETIVQDTNIRTIEDLAKANVDELLEEKKLKKQAGESFLKGVDEGRLVPFIRRAQYLISGAKGVKLLNPFSLPQKKIELYYDIEADPTQNFVYLHGVVERRDGQTKYIPFVADELNDNAEKATWKAFWDYVKSLPKDEYSMYHYGVYERVVNNKLLEKYPDVVTQEEIDKLFHSENTVDLYRIVDRDTDWPLKSYSLKPIAQLLGFKWRDVNPSGAASIMWYNEWLKTKDPKGIQRILDYNEDDCLATVILKDYLEIELKKYIEGLENQLQKPDENNGRISLPLV